MDASNIRSGGGVRHLVKMLHAAVPARHGVGEVVVWGAKELLAVLPEANWLRPVHVSALDDGWLQRIWWQQTALVGCLMDKDCDVLFAPGGTLPSRLPIPAVTMSQNLLPFDPMETSRYGAKLSRVRLNVLSKAQASAFRRSNGLIFLSTFAQDIILRTVGERRGEVAVIPHGLEPQFFLVPRSQHPIEDYGNDRPFRLLYVSVVDLYKHQWTVVEAVGALRHKGLPLTVDFVGPSYQPALRRLREVIRKWDPHDAWATYHGSVSQEYIHNVYRKANAFIFASSCENLPNVLLEAMAAGLPIACSNRGPMPQILGDEGFYFDPEQPEQIVLAIEKMVSDPVDRARKALGAYQKATAYSWERCADETFAFLTSVARNSN